MRAYISSLLLFIYYFIFLGGGKKNRGMSIQYTEVVYGLGPKGGSMDPGSSEREPSRGVRGGGKF